MRGKAVLALLTLVVLASPVLADVSSMAKLQEALAKASPQTKTCVGCHMQATPDIVMQWAASEHAENVPKNVLKLYEAIGSPGEQIAEKFQNYPYNVGCYECHGMFKEQDRVDVVNHFGFKIVSIVTAKDCSQCHPKEAREISWTWHGFGALNTNLSPWYSKIVKYAKEHGLIGKMTPPVYTATRDKDMLTWEWWKEYVKYLYMYLNGEKVPEEWAKFIEMFGTPYDYDFKRIVSPLYPASGGLNTTVTERVGFEAELSIQCAVGKSKYFQKVSNVMNYIGYKNAYVYHACYECHGSLVIPYKKENVNVKGFAGVERMRYWGWPSNGAGRIDPDGSLGTCTACHPRHEFSVAQAREPWTCGQCHIGYDHPHIEIYEESKHGNIYELHKEKFNMERVPWRVGVDFDVPTCATCHMSTIASPDGSMILVKGTHDLTKRLVWDQMHFFAQPKPKWPDNTQNKIVKGGNILNGAGYENVAMTGYKVVDLGPAPGELKFPRLMTIEYTGELKEHREEMMKVCELCHSSSWAENFFRTADQNLWDYNAVAQFAFQLLKKAWAQGIHDPKNKLDEFMEVMWYYIWHHQGRRWRNGAYMMGPDYAHWYGIVDTVMEALNKMISYYENALAIKSLQQQLNQVQQALAK
ncbi:multiheme c-type cytochrome [Ignicoccus hospitalis]|uniref:Hypothetical multiheme cytochrome n=1 Tax=Ignicoccus hospitalis (strain KIN4/I / DSM 18386 / JCM 14125) TaxID=453591 RepID=A8AC83_IGNH4|nr:multiheme c-type cytochrome [Ignicoccus hospitalis]ABU82535.1 hypothetical multiheme cytochrome [Ignicoccus hospitalis KIN4/I]